MKNIQFISEVRFGVLLPFLPPPHSVSLSLFPYFSSNFILAISSQVSYLLAIFCAGFSSFLSFCISISCSLSLFLSMFFFLSLLLYFCLSFSYIIIIFKDISYFILAALIRKLFFINTQKSNFLLH